MEFKLNPDYFKSCCYKCESRTVGCHSTCEKYAEMKAVLADYQEKRNVVLDSEKEEIQRLTKHKMARRS